MSISPDVPAGAPPSRHPGSRVVNRPPNLIRTIATIRDGVGSNTSRIRREDLAFAPADWTRGEPCTSATFINTHVTRVYRSGHAVFVDVAMGLGVDSLMEAQISVPDLAVTGPAVATVDGGGEQDLRLTLPLPESWELGDPYRLYIQARRTFGSDPTTVRVLRAWQR